jgi:hypothetical protein
MTGPKFWKLRLSDPKRRLRPTMALQPRPTPGKPMPLDPHIPTDPPNKAANEEVLAEFAEMNRAGRLVSLTVIGETADGYMSRYTLA